MEEQLDIPRAAPGAVPGANACAGDPVSVLAGLAQDPGNRGRIMLEAARLFTRKGFAATSVREIVEAAGVTKPTLYYYFKSKDDLFLSILDFAITSYMAALDAGLAAPGGARQRARAFVCSVFELLASNVDILRFVHAAFYGPVESTPRYDLRAAHEMLHDKLNQLLAGLAAERGMDPADTPALALLMHGLIEAIQCQLMKPEFGPLDQAQVAHCVDILLDGAAHRNSR
jgi:AcrR family transcriptional regulator